MADWLLEVDWLVVVQAVASVATLMVALKALDIWKNQKRTDRKLLLVDEITDAVHEFIVAIATPTQILDFIHIAIDGKKYDRDLETKYKHPQAIRLIETEGRRYSSQLISELSPCRPIVHRLESLLVKAQVFSIDNFDQCDQACRLIIWQYERLNAFYSILSSPNLNWEHPKISESLDKILEITPASIRSHIDENQVIALNFLRDLYAKELDISKKAKHSWTR